MASSETFHFREKHLLRNLFCCLRWSSRPLVGYPIHPPEFRSGNQLVANHWANSTSLCCNQEMIQLGDYCSSIILELVVESYRAAFVPSGNPDSKQKCLFEQCHREILSVSPSSCFAVVHIYVTLK